jgi:gliding motility-associated-like protein
MQKIFPGLVMLTLLTIMAVSTVSAQNVQSSRKYRVTAYKNGQPSVTSTSNTVEVVPFMSIYIPNSFTPNGDGLNDTFGVYGEAIKEFNMQIFNRWGQMIFETNNFNTQWDGKHDGVNVPQGTYVYKYTARGITGAQAYKDGVVTVIY